jgi:hypothetical protein
LWWVCLFVCLFFFEIGSHELFARAGFKLRSFRSLPPEELRLQAWAISAWQKCIFSCVSLSIVITAALKFLRESRVLIPVWTGLIPIILGTWEASIRRIVVWGQPRQIVHKTSISKISRAKWTGCVAQVVQRLLFKCKALSSNSYLLTKISIISVFASIYFVFSEWCFYITSNLRLCSRHYDYYVIEMMDFGVVLWIAFNFCFNRQLT